MIFVVIGSPGRFAEWCDSVAIALARGIGPAELIFGNSLAEIALGAIATGATRLIVAARQPGGGLRSTLADSGRNFILALDDPRRCLAELVLVRGMPFPAAVSALASSCAATLSCATMTGALPLWRERAWTEPAASIAAIANHLGLPIEDAGIAELCRIGSGADSLSLDWWNELDAGSRRIAEGALGPYLQHLATGELGAYNWAPDLFFLGDRPAERATGPVDITGMARCLLLGPNLVLPAGTWSLTVELVFSREAAEHDFHVEVVTDRQLASSTIRPHSEGACDVELSFVIDDSSDQPVLVRVSTLRAAFDGLVALSGARLLRHPEAAEPAPGGLPDSG